MDSIVLLRQRLSKNSPRVGLGPFDIARSDMPRHSETEVKPILLFEKLPVIDQKTGWEIYNSILDSLRELSSLTKTDSVPNKPSL